MIVRPATEDDVDAIVRMSAAFYATTRYVTLAPMCPDTVAQLTRWLIGEGVMLIAEDDSGPVGMVGLAVVPGMFNKEMLGAHEVVWYVTPDARGGNVGKLLLNAVEPACREKGAKAVWMMHLATSPPQAGLLYERLGFERSEINYFKGL